MPTSDALLTVKNVSLEFNQHQALHDVSLSVHNQSIVTLIGPNGAGKSSLVRVVLGLVTPKSGQVIRKKNLCIGYMPQRLHVDPVLPLTVYDFLRLGGQSTKTAICNVLAEVGAEHTLKRAVQAISGGELQRVLLARALLRQPDLLVLDEPIQGVDVTGQYALYDLIASIKHTRGCGILMVSHDLHLVMAATDYVVCLNKQVCCEGHPEAVTQHPAYLKLFGRQGAKELAVYTHHHEYSK